MHWPPPPPNEGRQRHGRVAPQKPGGPGRRMDLMRRISGTWLNRVAAYYDRRRRLPNTTSFAFSCVIHSVRRVPVGSVIFSPSTSCANHFREHLDCTVSGVAIAHTTFKTDTKATMNDRTFSVAAAQTWNSFASWSDVIKFPANLQNQTEI